MRLQKDLKKLKSLLLVIDYVLVAAVAAVLLGCGYYFVRILTVPQLDYEQARLSMEARWDAVLSELETESNRPAPDDADVELLEMAAALKLDTVNAEVEEWTAKRDTAQQALSDLQNPEQMKALIAELRTAYGQKVRELEDKILAGESEYRICYLTFDDGPSYQTGKFLDKLKELDAYGTFFTIGKSMPENSGLRNSYLKREAREGHTIANHTYSHAYYGSLYKSAQSFYDSVKQQDDLVYKVTGVHTDIVRFPSGSYYTPYRKSSIQLLEDNGYEWMDWIGNAYDAGGHGYSSSRIARTVIYQARHDKITVILMHDWNVDTLGALDEIVKTLRAEKYLFLPLFKESVTNGNCVPKWDD